jgi:hypothetical protein
VPFFEQLVSGNRASAQRLHAAVRWHGTGAGGFPVPLRRG